MSFWKEKLCSRREIDGVGGLEWMWFEDEVERTLASANANQSVSQRVNATSPDRGRRFCRSAIEDWFYFYFIHAFWFFYCSL